MAASWSAAMMIKRWTSTISECTHIASSVPRETILDRGLYRVSLRISLSTNYLIPCNHGQFCRWPKGIGRNKSTFTRRLRVWKRKNQKRKEKNAEKINNKKGKIWKKREKKKISKKRRNKEKHKRKCRCISNRISTYAERTRKRVGTQDGLGVVCLKTEHNVWKWCYAQTDWEKEFVALVSPGPSMLNVVEDIFFLNVGSIELQRELTPLRSWDSNHNYNVRGCPWRPEKMVLSFWYAKTLFSESKLLKLAGRLPSARIHKCRDTSGEGDWQPSIWRDLVN